MTSLLRTAAICVAALSLVVTTGCGSSDTNKSNDYVKAINKVQTDFAADASKVGSAPGGSDPIASAQKTFVQLKVAINKAIADLKNVEPPDKVKDLHPKLIAEMNQFGSEVTTAGDSLKTKDPQTILKAQSKFASDAGSIETKVTQTI